MNEYWAWLIIIGLVVLGVIYSSLKESRNKKLAETGEDLRRIKDAVARVLPGETGYTVAYAHYEDVSHYGRTTRTTYYAYALAFDAARLWIIPLGFQKNEILPGNPYLASENIGMADVKARAKNGVLYGVTVILRNKAGESPIHLDVDVLNTRKDRYHHVNVLQQEECEQFHAFITGVSETADKENADLKELMQEKASAQDARSGKILGILGIATFWTGLIGLIFGGIGLLCAPKPSKTGGRATAPFVLSLVATLLSLLTIVVFFVCVTLL